MSDVLARICENKRAHIRARKAEQPLPKLLAKLPSAAPPRNFVGALDAAATEGIGLIAEIKRSSPSKGLIRTDFDPPALARAYADGGASCLSVLTDTPYFQGEDAHLSTARDAVSLPALRKDFMLDPYQVIEARLLGADCILLIMAALGDGQAKELEAAAVEAGMAVLIEVHDAAELERTLAHLDSPLIGINNRNLKTLSVDIATTEQLAPLVPQGRQVVCESGIASPADIARMRHAGVYRFLIGDLLMRQDEVTTAVRTLMTPEKVT